MASFLETYSDHILEFDAEVARLWGWLRASHPENAPDKQIVATALIHDLTVVTRNHKDFERTSVAMLNPFAA